MWFYNLFLKNNSLHLWAPYSKQVRRLSWPVPEPLAQKSLFQPFNTLPKNILVLPTRKSWKKDKITLVVLHSLSSRLLFWSLREKDNISMITLVRDILILLEESVPMDVATLTQESMPRSRSNLMSWHTQLLYIFMIKKHCMLKSFAKNYQKELTPLCHFKWFRG